MPKSYSRKLVIMLAWISVHDHVAGGKLRELSKAIGCPQEWALGILVTLWLWGLDNCDSSGKVLNADKEDVLEAFSQKLLSRVNGAELVENLIATRWLDEPEPGVLFIHDWDTWQEQWYKFQQRKAYDAERKRQERAKKQAQIDVAPEVCLDTLENNDNNCEENKITRNRYSKGFEEFWQVYPRHVDKGNAYKKYAARLNDGYSDVELIAAAANYAKQCEQENTEPKYIKHPKTFLSEAMPFLDYLEKQKLQLKADKDSSDNKIVNPWAEEDDD